MNTPSQSTAFTDEEKRECCLMMSMGCDRQTACHYLGKTATELRMSIQDDDEFHRRLLRAEATPEFNHMRNVYNASKDEKHWRASVWWLERRAPDRYARQAPETVTAAQLQKFVESLTEAIVGEVTDSHDQQRLLHRLYEIAQSLDDTNFECPVDAKSTPGQNLPLQIVDSQLPESENS